MIQKTIKICLYNFLILCLFSSYSNAEFIDDFKKRAKSLYLLHSVQETARTTGVRQGKEKKKALIHAKADSRHLEMLSYIPNKSILLPINDVQKIVKRIERLTKKIETTKEGEKSQRMKFDMAYEYFLLYVHYLHEKYGVTRASDLNMEDRIPVSDKELKQYLALSEYYLKTFLSKDNNQKDVFVKGRQIFKVTDDISFRVRNYKNIYLNVYFLAMMLECEKLAGEWGNTSESIILSETYDQKAWYWLDSLWKRHFKSNRDVAAYKPTTKTLFNLYELYLRYHFVGRYLRNFSSANPLQDAQTRTLLNRLYALQKEGKLNQKKFYNYYKNEAIKDSNNSNFIVNLYLARRGYFATRDLNFSLPKKELFEIYRYFYDNAAKHIKHKIAYRSNIYNELILFGVGIDNIRLMEDELFNYATISMRLQDSEQNSTSVKRIKDSSQLTMAYLIANILDKKRRSGLDQNSEIYRDLAESLTPRLVNKKTNRWEYASIIHSALSMYYSRLKGASKDINNESLAMYHAKKAFMAPCEKLYITYGSGKESWMKFFKLPGAVSYLKLFTDFQKKYQTSSDAVMPREFNSGKIIGQYRKMKWEKTK